MLELVQGDVEAKNSRAYKLKMVDLIEFMDILKVLDDLIVNNERIEFAFFEINE